MRHRHKLLLALSAIVAVPYYWLLLDNRPGSDPGPAWRLADGREVLFAGDTATMALSWQQLRARSRLIGELLGDEDRAAVFGWLKAIRRLHREAPALIVIPGHEYEALTLDAPRNRLGFAFPAAR